jgi:hypothetical protein
MRKTLVPRLRNTLVAALPLSGGKRLVKSAAIESIDRLRFRALIDRQTFQIGGHAFHQRFAWFFGQISAIRCNSRSAPRSTPPFTSDARAVEGHVVAGMADIAVMAARRTSAGSVG